MFIKLRIIQFSRGVFAKLITSSLPLSENVRFN